MHTLSAACYRTSARHSAPRQGALEAVVRQVAVDLTPQAVEQVAARVVQLIDRQQRAHDHDRTREEAGLLTVAKLAKYLDLNPAYVYEHADELGAIRIGDGPKARIRFDLPTASAALKQLQQTRRQRPSETSQRERAVRPLAQVGGGRGRALFAQTRRPTAERPDLPADAVEQIARRVVELLRLEGATIQTSQGTQPELVDAEELARRFGLTRTWIYENAGRLGAVKLSDGPRSRLRFDPQVAAQALRRCSDPPPATEPPLPAPTGRRRRRRDVSLLPIYEPGPRGAFARRHPINRRGH